MTLLFTALASQDVRAFFILKNYKVSKKHEVRKRKAAARLEAAAYPIQVKEKKVRVKGPSKMAPIEDALKNWRTKKREMRKKKTPFTGVYERVGKEFVGHFRNAFPIQLTHVEAVVLGLK